jgi:hypothetical protein
MSWGQALAKRPVVVGPVGLEVVGQVLVGVAPAVGAEYPDLLAAQLVPQGLEHAALVHAAQDPLPAALVGAVQQLLEVRRDHALDGDLLAAGVVAGGMGGGGLVPLDQPQRLDHRGVGGVGGAELQRLQQLDQAVAVVVGVGGLEHPLLVLAKRRPLRPELAQQVDQRLHPAGRWVDHLADRVVGGIQCRLGDLEQDVLLARDPFELGDDLLDDLLLGPGVDPVHGGEQQVDQGVGELAFAAVQQGGEQGVLGRLRVGAQVAWGFDRGPGPPAGDDLGSDVDKQPGGQADRPDRLQLGDFFLGGLQAHVARVGLDGGEHLPPILAILGVLAALVGGGLAGVIGVIAGLGDQGQHPGSHLGRDTARDPYGQGLLGLPQRRGDDPAEPGRGRRLDALVPQVPQEFLAYAFGAALTLADVLGQPGGVLVGVGDSALAEPQERADLGAVVLERAACPFVEAELFGWDVDLAGEVGDRVLGKLAAAAGEAAVAGGELEQQRKPQARRPALAGDLGQLLADQGPVLDQLVFVDRAGHGRLGSFDAASGHTAASGTVAKTGPEVPTSTGGGTPHCQRSCPGRRIRANYRAWKGKVPTPSRNPALRV